MAIQGISTNTAATATQEAQDGQSRIAKLIEAHKKAWAFMESICDLDAQTDDAAKVAWNSVDAMEHDLAAELFCCPTNTPEEAALKAEYIQGCDGLMDMFGFSANIDVLLTRLSGVNIVKN